MTMKTIQVDVSSDIVDKVISFLEILPTAKVHIKTKSSTKTTKKREDSLVDFFRSSPLVGLDIKRS